MLETQPVALLGRRSADQCSDWNLLIGTKSTRPGLLLDALFAKTEGTYGFPKFPALEIRIDAVFDLARRHFEGRTRRCKRPNHFDQTPGPAGAKGGAILNQPRELICCRWYHYRGERFLFFFHAHQVQRAQMSALSLWEQGLLSYAEAEEICDSLARCAGAGAA